MSIAEQFAGLEMEGLIGGSLKAAEEAGSPAASSTADFSHDVGIDADGELPAAPLGDEEHSADDAGTCNPGTGNPEEKKGKTPMPTIVPIPNLQIDETNMCFDMEVKQTEKPQKAADAGTSLSESMKFGQTKSHITGNVSSHSSTGSPDNPAKYHVDVRPANQNMPEGLSRMPDMPATGIPPTPAGSELKDGNESIIPS